MLERAGYLPFLAMNGHSALSLVVDESPDLIVLDLGLPDIDGWEICRRVREFSFLPIIVLSVRDTEWDRIKALRAGADHYIVKPVVAQELLAVIEAVLRRIERNGKKSPELSFSDSRLSTDFPGCCVRVDGVAVSLTSLELRLLQELVRYRNKVLTPAQILSRVWGIKEGDNNGILRTCIWRLRKAIEENPRHPRYIVGVRGVGYMFSASQQENSPLTPSLADDFTPPLFIV